MNYKKVSKAQMKENDDNYRGCVMLEPREWLDNAIIGKCAITGGVTYDKDVIIEIFMQKDKLDYYQAREMVDYNTERAIPYMPDPKPILVEEDVADFDMDDYDDDDD